MIRVNFFSVENIVQAFTTLYEGRFIGYNVKIRL
jgi:hypothetical protein